MKNRSKVILFVVLFFTLFGLIYGLGVFYFWNRFLPNSWLDGTYVTGYTAEEAKQTLSMEVPEAFTIQYGEEKILIPLTQCEISIDYKEQIIQDLRGQSPFSWPFSVGKRKTYYSKPEYSLDKGKLQQSIFENESIKLHMAKPVVELTRDENGIFVLQDDDRYLLDVSKVTDAVYETLLQGEVLLEAGEAFTYEVPYDSAQQHDVDLYARIDRFTNRKLILDMGDEQPEFDKEDLQRWLILGDDDKLTFDYELMEQDVRDALEPYNTASKCCSFQSTEGRVVEVSYKTYGTEIDIDGAVTWMEETLSDDFIKEATYEPVYRKEGYHKGLNDIGSTYVEVDMTMQKLYFYRDGEIALECSVVTGNVKRKMDTPEGIFYIYFKQHNRTLQGGGTPAFVHDWMAIYKGVGLHDASWRKEFGGEIYKTDGSHGCINMPSEQADALYDMVEVGMPVVVFY